MQVRRVPGTALANDATAEVIYTPPEGEDRIRGLLANWERFLHGEDGAGDIDPLVHCTPGVRIALLKFESLVEELELLTGRRVDLGTKRGLKPWVRENIFANTYSKRRA